jgi:signal transduction histidine kinase
VIWTISMAVVVALSLVGQHLGQHASGAVPYLGLDIAVGCASVALVPFLARWPVVVTVVLSALAVFSLAATAPATMAILLVARWRRLAIAVGVAAAGVAAHLIREQWRPYPGLSYAWWTALVGVTYAALVGWGTLIRANRALISSLLERAEHAEAEQARRVAETRRAERARIAREMHDVLAHRLSLLATYAGAISYHPDAPPQQLSSAAEVIRSGAHQALAELREVISVLRQDEAPGPATASRPLPGIADLPQLIEETRKAGTLVSVVDDAPSLSQVPDAIGRIVYRVVQEGLTNARKHAPGEPVRIAFSGVPGAGAEVDITNQLPAARAASAVPGTGTGLIGLAERLDLAGGRLDAGDRDDRGTEFGLHAWLPWPERQPERQPERRPE